MCNRVLASDRAVGIMPSVHDKIKIIMEVPVEIVKPEDSKTMEEILTRDQRTTRHRRLSFDLLPMKQQQQQQQQQQQHQHQQQQGEQSSQQLASEVTDSSNSNSNSNCRRKSVAGDKAIRCCGDDVSCYSSKIRMRDVDVEKTTTRTVTTTTVTTTKTSTTTTRTKEDDVNNMYSKVVSRGCDDEQDKCWKSAITRADIGVRGARFAIACTMWLRLGSLLVALLAVTVQSAPTMTLQDKRLSVPPKWMNPCGFAAEEFNVDDADVVQLNDEVLLGNIVMQAKTALNYAQGFRDDYIKRTFNTDYADLHLTWKDNHYEWLPGLKQIPKQLGEQLDQEFLDKLEVRMLITALQDAYEYMQRYAVGLEQITWDQEDYGLEFHKQFKDTEYHLRSVLCELQMALAEKTVEPKPDVSRDIMPREYRKMSESATFRNLRDWMIFRDYMNGLEFVIQVFEQLIRSIES